MRHRDARDSSEPTDELHNRAKLAACFDHGDFGNPYAHSRTCSAISRFQQRTVSGHGPDGDDVCPRRAVEMARCQRRGALQRPAAPGQHSRRQHSAAPCRERRRSSHRKSLGIAAPGQQRVGKENRGTEKGRASRAGTGQTTAATGPGACKPAELPASAKATPGAR